MAPQRFAKYSQVGPIIGIAGAVVLVLSMMLVAIIIAFVGPDNMVWIIPAMSLVAIVGTAAWMIVRRDVTPQPSQIASSPSQPAPESQSTAAPGEVIASTQLVFSWKVGPHVAVLALVLAGLIVSVAIADDFLEVQIVILATAVGVMIVPFNDDSRRTMRESLERWRRIRLRLLILTIVIVAIAFVFTRLTGFDLRPLITNVANAAWETFSFLFQSLTSSIAVVAFICLVKLLVVWRGWQKNRVSKLATKDPDLFDLLETRGVFFPTNPTGKGEKRTGMEPLAPFTLFGWAVPWRSLRVEDTGQDQPISFLHGLPPEFLTELGVKDPVDR